MPSLLSLRGRAGKGKHGASRSPPTHERHALGAGGRQSVLATKTIMVGVAGRWLMKGLSSRFEGT